MLDANILVAGIPATSGTLSALIDLWRAGAFRPVLSQHILDEVLRAWTKPYWQSRLPQGERNLAISLLQQEAERTGITVQVSGIATHPEDDLVLATALSADVPYLVTGDKGLLTIRAYGGTSILTANEFLALFPLQNGDQA
ncbi:MAG TPA: putative toxin-antitoxin system toxin component, PIN family [Thermomicrobiales bacterium]|nr:putative toxin-antitoxin system toxin component, PIN family [Thermomicrobiales bacterium]